MPQKRRFRIGERLEARRNAGQQQGTVLTAEDAANLDDFAIRVQQANELLREEIAAIGEGRLNVVSELFGRKAEILKSLELKLPLIEPFMTHKGAAERNLPTLLAELKRTVSEDSALLSRMAVAAGTIVREIEKARNRNSLNGNYGKTGEKIGRPSGAQRHLDRKL